MSAVRLTPIPTPLKQRVGHLKRTVLPGLVVCGALMLTGFLWHGWIGAPVPHGPANSAVVNSIAPQNPAAPHNKFSGTTFQMNSENAPLHSNTLEDQHVISRTE